MVKLDVIMTRGGDGGETSLGDGARVRKDALRVEAYGTVDEANAAIGVLRLHASAVRATCSRERARESLLEGVQLRRVCDGWRPRGGSNEQFAPCAMGLRALESALCLSLRQKCAQARGVCAVCARCAARKQRAEAGCGCLMRFLG